MLLPDFERLCRESGASRSRGVLLLLLLCLLAACDRASSSHYARSNLFDDAGALLGPEASRRIRAYLAWVGEQYGIDYHVVVAELDGATPEERAVELFAERAPGGLNGGKGLLLLVDPRGQQVRVEVGYALEPYLTDLAASRMLSDYLAPYFRSGDASAGIEASIEALVERIRPGLEASAQARVEPTAQPMAVVDATARTAAGDLESARTELPPSGGGGASLDLARALPEGRLDDITRDSLRSILVPQPDPRQARDLEIALLHKGFYLQEAELYDAAWRAAARRSEWNPSRLKQIARQWDRPYEVSVEEPHAVAYYRGARDLGPVFLRREAKGWVIDASAGARGVVYDYSNQCWYVRDEPSPYVDLLRQALPLRRVTLGDGGAAWMME
jgi:hypothetical protein